MHLQLAVPQSLPSHPTYKQQGLVPDWRCCDTGFEAGNAVAGYARSATAAQGRISGGQLLSVALLVALWSHFSWGKHEIKHDLCNGFVLANLSSFAFVQQHAVVGAHTT